MTDFHFQPKGLKSEFGWYTRGYLPHFDGGQTSQFVTVRLCDSMPQELLDKWRKADLTDAAFRRNVERYLDAGYGKCWLKEPQVASMVEESLIYLDEKSYRLISWVIMPNHVHVLFTPNTDSHLDEILHSFKSYTAHKANKLLGRTGQFWQHESFDRYIRNTRHFYSVIRYIEKNPVKARLCADATDWLFGSARLRGNFSND